MNRDRNIEAAVRQFKIDGVFVDAMAYGSGHINDTYLALFDNAGIPARFIVQRINRTIFKNPGAMMENIQRVTAHLASAVAGEPDCERHVLTLIPTRNEQAWHVDAKGEYWRAYQFIEGARTYDAVENTDQAYQAAKAFGRFQELLGGLGAPRLHDTIPDFHNTPKRYAAFEKAIAADVAGRVNLARPEIEYALAHALIAGMLLGAGLPERVTHNDTKFNNVMLDDETGEGICVIDLDTVMPGLALYDFGDMVRTTTSPAKEDEQDLSKVTLQFPMFEALVRGYLGSAGDFLTGAEKNHLVTASKVITFEQGIRFLGDYLSGDTYYKVHREGHNLDRCRTQFKLLESIEQQEDAMERLVRAVSAA